MRETIKMLTRIQYVAMQHHLTCQIYNFSYSMVTKKQQQQKNIPVIWKKIIFIMWMSTCKTECWCFIDLTNLGYSYLFLIQTSWLNFKYNINHKDFNMNSKCSNASSFNLPNLWFELLNGYEKNNKNPSIMKKKHS